MKEQTNLIKDIIKITRDNSKESRQVIKDPTKLCDCCMNQWIYFTIKEEKLCNECYEEEYVKTKVG